VRLVDVAFDRELDERSGIGQCGHQMQREQRHQRQVGGVRHDQFTGLFGHFRDAPGTREAAEVTDVRLHDVHGIHADHPPPLRHVVVLLAAGHFHLQCGSDFGRPLQFPVRARLFKKVIAVVLHPPADFDRLGRRVAAVGICQQFDLVTHRLADRRDQFLGPAGRGVPVMPGRDPHPHLERSESVLVAQSDDPRGLVFRRDVAPHARPVDGERIRAAPDQLADRLVPDLAVEVPDRGVDSRQRAADKGPGILHVGIDHAIHQGVDLRRVATQDVAGHVAVQQDRRDVRVERGKLPVPLLAVLGGDAHDPERAQRPGFDPRDGSPRVDDLEVGVVIRPPYHVLNHANARLPIFERDEDFAAFERILAEGRERYDMRILAYCLLSNHWHWILWPKRDGDLSRFVGWVTLTHTQRWHAYRGSTGSGHVYQGRFKSFPIQDDDHFYVVCRYVERNALRAMLVEQAEQWRWSVCGGGNLAPRRRRSFCRIGPGHGRAVGQHT
jgi:REP element-mobilizing transposase RayT